MRSRIKLTLVAGFLVVTAVHAQWIGRPEPAWESKLQVWVADPHKRVYPNSFGRDLVLRNIVQQVCRNEHVIIQLGARSPKPVDSLSVTLADLKSQSGAVLPSRLFRVRYAGLIPADENAQYTPDPLWDERSVSLRPYQSQGIWISGKVPATAEPGTYEGALQVTVDGRNENFLLKIDVLRPKLPDPSDFQFFLNILMDPSSVARFKGLPLWGEQHWREVEKYVRNLAMHGQKTINVFIVDDPWAGITGFPVRTAVEWKAAGEWKPGMRMEFDFRNFDRYVEMNLKAGIRDHIECWSPLVQPHADHSIITYTDTSSGQIRKVKLPAGSPEYKAAWGTFAREFEAHLRQKGWLDTTYLAFDEITSDVLDRVVPVMREVAPNLKLMMSGGDEKGHYLADARHIAFYYGAFSPNSGFELPDIAARRRQGKRTLLYTAVGPAYPNTFIFSTPLESRYMGWIIHKWDFDGYIRWAWNFWPAALWDQPLFTWPSGDMFFVYPGADGPIDSIRSQMLLKGIEDYEAIRLVRNALDRLRSSGRSAEIVKRSETALNSAVELATTQYDPKDPHDRSPSRMDEARNTVNKLLIELNVEAGK